MTRIAYPSVLVSRIIKGLISYQVETERLYIKGEKDALVNFGIPIRFTEETTNTVNGVRQCIIELNKWIENELLDSDHLRQWSNELIKIFPNLNLGVEECQSVKICKTPWYRK